MSTTLVRVLSLCALLIMTQIAEAQSYLKLGSWNIEHLGKRPSGQHPKALAEHLLMASVDVLALQEIYDTDDNDGTRTNKKLDDTFALVNKQPGQAWEYVLFANSDMTDTSQLCGVAWNKARVQKVGDPLRLKVEDDDPNDDFKLWDRHPHAIKFSAGAGKTDFVLISLHMKSNVDEVQFGQTQRAKEAKTLVDQLATVKQHFKDQDVILIGDTNVKDANEEAVKQFVGAGYIDLNAGDLSTFFQGQAPFDRIFIPQGQPEFKFSRQYCLKASNAQGHEKSLSDHFMIMAMFQIQDDDD